MFQRERALRWNYLRQWRISVEQRKLAEEQSVSLVLLENIMPSEIVTRLLQDTQGLIADSFENVTILWTDMKGFTEFSASRSPLEVVAFLK